MSRMTLFGVASCEHEPAETVRLTLHSLMRDLRSLQASADAVIRFYADGKIRCDYCGSTGKDVLVDAVKLGLEPEEAFCCEISPDWGIEPDRGFH